MWEHILHDALTLFVVIDPIGLIPIFIVVTRNEDKQRRNEIALWAVFIAGIILLAFLLGGQFLLDELGITVPAFMIAGGIILLIIGLKMVLQDNSDHTPAEDTPDIQVSTKSLAVFPIAIPFIAGPGTIMTIILLTDNTKFAVNEQMVTVGVLMGILGLTYVILAASDWILKVLGATGINVITRVIGLLIAALAIEQFLEGIDNFFLK